jgi:Ca2+-transporting ATPase
MVQRTGLSSADATRLLERFGPNEVKEKQNRAAWHLFIAEFKSPLVLLLVLACLVSAFLREWVESTAIASILVLNAVIGFFQEYRAEKAVRALAGMTAPRARVIRDGKQIVLPAREIVPGDLLVLEAGDLIAADGKVLEAARLQVNEAVLTGESIPVEKSATAADGKVFMGTAVAFGTGLVEATGTGMSTELGKVANLIATASAGPTPLQLELARVGKMLLLLCLAVAAAVMLMGWLQHRPWPELLVFSVSLAVAAVPEGLPAIVTVALALGVQRMALRNALVRSLPSVETLGSVSVICTDKTGTLTTGRMRIRETWGESHLETLKVAASCCDAELDPTGAEGSGDPTELAILIAARERGIEKQAIESASARVSSEPFDSDRRRMSVYRADGILYVKGALESVLPLCTRSASSVVENARRANDEFATRGLRVLAVARGRSPQEAELEVLGLLGIADPPRTEVMQAIAEARTAGVRPVMITGDHPATAAAIARELGLVLEGEKLEGLVHARATPEDKLRLVREWKSRGAIVAMTGDGVNDAPALREAHVGIAMGKAGTEVTRQSADLILVDDNFATIVEAIREGRGVYRNIRKAVLYLLSGNFGELMIVFGASALMLPIPFLAPHLLWINLVTDALPALALVADPVTMDVMNQPPRPASQRLLGKREWMGIAGIGTLEALIILSFYLIQLDRSGPEEARSLAFSAFVLSQLFRAFSARSRSRTFWEVGALGNLWLLVVVLVAAALQLSLHFIPLGQTVFGLRPIDGEGLLWIIPASLVATTLIELRKLLARGRAIAR